jgi:hypothetical protein
VQRFTYMARICLTDGGSTGKCMPKPETSSALHSCTYSCQLINPGESASGIDDFFFLKYCLWYILLANGNDEEATCTFH